MSDTKYILHVEDEDIYHQNLLALLKRVAEAKGVSFEEVQKRVIHKTNFDDAQSFMREQKSNIEAIFIDNQMDYKYVGKDLVYIAYDHAPEAILVWASTSEPDEFIKKYVRETRKRGIKIASDPRLIDEDELKAILNNQHRALGLDDAAVLAIQAASEAIDRLGIDQAVESERVPDALKIARGQGAPRTGIDQADRSADDPLGLGGI